MILEGIVTTLDSAEVLNVAPMGPLVEPGGRRYVLRPFRTSTTYRNLVVHGEGVLHVTDDSLLLARSAIGQPVEVSTRRADVVRGQILLDACRYVEFRVTERDDRDERATLRVEAVAEGRLRDFFGWNRGKHAVVEAAILATRVDWLPPAEVLAEFRRLAVPVRKTGGPAEEAAFALLVEHVWTVARARGFDPDHLGLDP